MTKHLTVRMAWHDNKWNGKVCRNPKKNVYCVGSHSLLSERLARERNLDNEIDDKSKIDSLLPNYIPPCYWSSNAFSPESADIVHTHAFQKYKDRKIKEKLPPYSVYTWPFRLSFNHSEDKLNTEGKYPIDLKQQIINFFDKFKKDESIVFFYLNFDNPVSAEDYKYALVGCAKFTEIGKPTYFNFTESELESLKSGDGMQNFDPINWAIRLTHDFVNTGIRLPYHEYLEKINQDPDIEEKLNEMRVLVEEEALVQPGFKYVAEELDNDRCLYLLYKLRKSIKIVQKHGIVKLDREEKLIDKYIEDVWKMRGLYPALGSVVDLLVDLAESGSAQEKNGNELVAIIRKSIPENTDLLTYILSLLSVKAAIPEKLHDFKKTIKKARLGLRDHTSLLEVLKKLSLFSLTEFQLRRILFPRLEKDEDHPFGGKEISPKEITDNPYILCEEYIPLTNDTEELDQPELRDGPIGLFNIDIGMFPDENYIECNEEMQNLTPASPERLRALIIEYLNQIGNQGHCFASLDGLYEYVIQHPLFYRVIDKQSLFLNKLELVTPRHRNHYALRLSIVDSDGETYFYLREVKYAENLIEQIAKELLDRKDYKLDLSWIDGYLVEESKELQKNQLFDVNQFISERKKLLEGLLSKAFFINTGKPGSGKTRALKIVINKLRQMGESVTVLSLTGKAVLRIKEETEFEDSQTIDMFIIKSGFSDCLDNLESLQMMKWKPNNSIVENLIIDESSMIDLQRLAILFQSLQLQGLPKVKRVILVGDENQLPPIGLGRPFYDIISYIKQDKKLRENHFIRLTTNCRQEFDPKILKVAEIFVGKNRYYQELFDELKKGGNISPGLKVEHWNTTEELSMLIDKHLQDLIKKDLDSSGVQDKGTGFNQLLGLYPTGYVKQNSNKSLKIDKFQILTPYRSGSYGTLGLNEFIRDDYKKDLWPDLTYTRSLFCHSEKIIRTKNWYKWNKDERRNLLFLSNGSIGILCNQKHGRKMYFPDAKDSIWWEKDEEENFELAYAITIHKAQGSEFNNVFVVVPERKSLLSKELFYTAFTRSKGPLSLFIQHVDRESPIEVAKNRSFVLARNTSIFSKPMDAKRILEPEPGIQVKSMIEYIIYSAIKKEHIKGRLNFFYENPLDLKIDGKIIRIKPDFTIDANGKRYYWEHLGLLDQRDYFKDWQQRRGAYEANGFGDVLITTDNLNGVQQERVQQLIEHIIQGSLQNSKDNTFSNHHYLLYTE